AGRLPRVELVFFLPRPMKSSSLTIASMRTQRQPGLATAPIEAPSKRAARVAPNFSVVPPRTGASFVVMGDGDRTRSPVGFHGGCFVMRLNLLSNSGVELVKRPPVVGPASNIYPVGFPVVALSVEYVNEGAASGVIGLGDTVANLGG